LTVFQCLKRTADLEARDAQFCEVTIKSGAVEVSNGEELTVVNSCKWKRCRQKVEVGRQCSLTGMYTLLVDSYLVIKDNGVSLWCCSLVGRKEDRAWEGVTTKSNRL
jgi:hypothetical protein